MLEDIARWADRRGKITVATIRRWHRQTMAGLDVPDSSDQEIRSLVEECAGSDGRRLAPGAPRPPERPIGDPGACPGAPPIEAAADDENPRHRIVRAAVLLQRSESGPASPCAAEVLGE